MNLLQPEDVSFLESLITYKESFSIRSFCFDKQVAFIEDPAKYKVAVCSRRAGKTVSCAAHMMQVALTNPNRVCLYITLSRINAKRIVWPDLLRINRDYSLGGIPNDTELSLRFSNGSVIYCSGAKDKSEIDNFRGLPITLCYIDECQSFKAYIRELIEEVISKAMYDHDGTLCLTGTPGPVPVGFFYDCWTSDGWSKHAWTMFDNPWIEKKSGKTARQLVQEECNRRGVTIEDPTIQRECFGRWTVDADCLVFKYNPMVNHFDQVPVVNDWHYIFGVDLGFDDSDAIAVIAWNEKQPAVYLVEEVITSKQGVTALADQIAKLIATYNPDAIMMDTGGIGKKIAHEMSQRFGLPIKAAEKVRKFEYIELLNDALRTSRFKAKKDSQFAEDSMLVEWDKDSTQLKISDRFHSDICDAVLYAFRESLHWLHVPEKPKSVLYSPEWMAEQAEALEQQALKTMERKNSLDDDNTWGSSLISDKDWD